MGNTTEEAGGRALVMVTERTEHILSSVEDFIPTDTVVSTLYASSCHTHPWQQVLVLVPFHRGGVKQLALGHPVTEPDLKARPLVPSPCTLPD